MISPTLLNLLVAICNLRIRQATERWEQMLSHPILEVLGVSLRKESKSNTVKATSGQREQSWTTGLKQWAEVSPGWIARLFPLSGPLQPRMPAHSSVPRLAFSFLPYNPTTSHFIPLLIFRIVTYIVKLFTLIFNNTNRNEHLPTKHIFFLNIF